MEPTESGASVESTEEIKEFDVSALVIEQAQRMLEKHATPNKLRTLLDTPSGFDFDLWQAVVEMGLIAAPMSEDYEGMGLGWPILCELAALVGRFAAAIPIIPAAIAVSALGAGEPQLARRIASGEIIMAADLGGPDRDGFAPLKILSGTLNGSSRGCAFAAVAGVMLTVANDGNDLALITVELSQEGVTRTPIPSIDNGRGAARVDFAGASLSSIGGAAEIERARLAAAVVTAFEQIGGAQQCLTLACEFARERKAFGQPIGRFQAVKHKLADMYAGLELARGCAYAALEALESGAEMRKEAAAARLAATEAYEFAARETIQVFGALGVTWEAPAHIHYRRSRTLAIELGSSMVWRDSLVDALLAARDGS
jgi:acyl-CoA dehydrogenase